jgi:hypothetical protein
MAKAAPTTVNIRPAKKSFWLLILMNALSERVEDGRSRVPERQAGQGRERGRATPARHA